MKGLRWYTVFFLVNMCWGAPLSSPSIKIAFVEQAVSQMVADAGFQEFHQSFCGERGRKPRLQVPSIANYTGERQFGVESLRDHLIVRLRATELFEMVPDADLDMDSEWDASGHLGEWVAEDWRMIGRYRISRDGNRHHHELALHIVDVNKGVQIWSDVVVISTTEEEGGTMP